MWWPTQPARAKKRDRAARGNANGRPSRVVLAACIYQPQSGSSRHSSGEQLFPAQARLLDTSGPIASRSRCSGRLRLRAPVHQSAAFMGVSSFVSQVSASASPSAAHFHSARG
jgi:hypothetical protein